jgi:hypothetical protein
MIREITNDDKEKVIDYLRLTRRVSQGGKPELIENVSVEEKKELKKLFDHFREHGIIVYLSRTDELVFKGIPNWDHSYNWETEPSREPSESEKARSKEWLKNINTLLSKKRDKGEGGRMAEEIINYMNRDFMGGINV